MTKRADGALEHDIMAVLWAAAEPMLPAEIKAHLPNELAYTSVATVLGRLQAKGLVERRLAGRAFGYWATVNESALAARRINEVLSGTSDRRAALVGFVGSLSKRDAKALLALLNESDR
jgi:predicted transcriptional regulator